MSLWKPPPGLRLREAHVHLAWHGRALGMLRLGGCSDGPECLEIVRVEAERLGRLRKQDWLMGVQMRVEGWREPRWPTREELDRVTGGRPAWLMSFDHHSLVANSAALAAAGLRDGGPDPEGGVLGRDATGRLTGLCLEAAARKVREAAPEPPAAELREHVRTAARDLARLGFVEVHDLLTAPWLPGVLAELHDAGELPVRVGMYPLVEHVEGVDAGRKGWERPGLTLMGGKVFVDGTLNARTAWVLAAHADGAPGHPFGTALMTAGRIREAIDRCAGVGVGLAAHAIGDAAVRACLDAMEGARAAGVRQVLRVEHAELVDRADVGRFARLGVTASVQPCHLLYDIEALERSQPGRLGRVLPLRELIDSGLRPGEGLIFGSDTPIVRPDPEDSVQAAVGRGRAEGGPRVAPEQAITEAEAWACFGAG